MKLRPTLLAALLALGVGRSFAREPDAPPSPVVSGTPANHSLRTDAENAGQNIFVGHFGETLRLPYFVAVDAKMQGPMERINFHFKTVDPANFFSKPFSPEAGDFVPKNFARLRLMQMLVIPKDVPGGFRSLDALREAKTKELSATGNPFNLRPGEESTWPPETFWVWISTPYPLFQLYTQSDKNFFIVTIGEDPFVATPQDRFLASSGSSLCNSLSTYLDQFAPPLVEEVSFLDIGVAALPWAAICVIAVALGFLPKNGKWLGSLRLIGRMTFGLATVALLIGGLLLIFSMRHGLGRTINEASILLSTGIIMPWICRAASARLNGRSPWRVFAWSAVANILPVTIGLVVTEQFYSGAKALSASPNLRMLSFMLCVTSLLNGIAFGLAHRDSGS